MRPARTFSFAVAMAFVSGASGAPSEDKTFGLQSAATRQPLRSYCYSKVCLGMTLREIRSMGAKLVRHSKLYEDFDCYHWHDLTAEIALPGQKPLFIIRLLDTNGLEQPVDRYLVKSVGLYFPSKTAEPVKAEYEKLLVGSGVPDAAVTINEYGNFSAVTTRAIDGEVTFDARWSGADPLVRSFVQVSGFDVSRKTCR